MVVVVVAVAVAVAVAVVGAVCIEVVSMGCQGISMFTITGSIVKGQLHADSGHHRTNRQATPPINVSENSNRETHPRHQPLHSVD